jgi:hypothetical protein
VRDHERLRTHAEARSVRVVRPEQHVTQDPRLTVVGVQEAIVLGQASPTWDIEIKGSS